MKLTIKNLKKNKELITVGISSLFHDLGILEYKITDNSFSVIFSRPCYEEAKLEKWFGIINMYLVPNVRTRVEISPVNNINKFDEMSWGVGDCFFYFDIDKGNEMIVAGILDKHKFIIDTKTRLKIEDITKPDWNNTRTKSKNYLEKEKKLMSEILAAKDVTIDNK